MYNKKEIDIIKNHILDFYDIKNEEFSSDTRRQPIVEARQIFFYCLREKYRFSFSAIGRLFNKDHTTILYAYKKIKKDIKDDKRLNRFVESIKYFKMPEDADSYDDKDVLWQEANNIWNDQSNQFDEDNKKGFDTEEEDEEKENKIYNLPIKFNDVYLENIFSGLEERKRNIFQNRYQFKENNLRTLEDISIEENITRERVRQIISSTIHYLFKNDYDNVGQIIYFVEEKIKKDKIISIENLLKEIFIFDQNDKNSAKKFLIVLLSILKDIKQFNFSGQIFLIDIKEEENILKEIDDIKLIIKNNVTKIPEEEKNKKKYIIQLLEKDEYFLDKVQIVNDDFLGACYDNYLFESSVVVYEREDLYKYKASNLNEIEQKENQKNIKGVPDEYSIFFK